MNVAARVDASLSPRISKTTEDFEAGCHYFRPEHHHCLISIKSYWLRGCGRLRGSISCFIATRSSQMNSEVANDVDMKHSQKPRSIVRIQFQRGRHVGRYCVGVYSNICVVARSNLHTRVILQLARL